MLMSMRLMPKVPEKSNGVESDPVGEDMTVEVNPEKLI